MVGTPTEAILLTEEEAAKIIDFTIRTLQKWRCTGEGPRFVRAGRSIRYRRVDLDTWIEERLRSSTSEYRSEVPR